MIAQAHKVSESYFFFLKKKEFFKVILTKYGGSCANWTSK